jgi:hypothetical protein
VATPRFRHVAVRDRWNLIKSSGALSVLKLRRHVSYIITELQRYNDARRTTTQSPQVYRGESLRGTILSNLSITGEKSPLRSKPALAESPQSRLRIFLRDKADNTRTKLKAASDGCLEVVEILVAGGGFEPQLSIENM